MKRIANKGGSGRSRFFRLMNLPIRALSRARDYYISRMVDCGQVPCYSGAHDVGVGLPRSFSVARVADNHRSEDFRELVRVASVRTLARSASVGVGMGKINEDDRFSFDGDEDDETRRLRFDDGENGGGGGAGGRKQSLVVFWRSKSYAVTTKRSAF